VTSFSRGGSIFVTICDKGGGEGVKICPKTRDVIYERPLLVLNSQNPHFWPYYATETTSEVSGHPTQVSANNLHAEVTTVEILPLSLVEVPFFKDYLECFAPPRQQLAKNFSSASTLSEF